MTVNGFDIQRDFFNEAKKTNSQMMIFLTSGKRIIGRIKVFDKFTLLVETDKGDQLVFKHAVSNISSAKQFGNYINFEPLKPGKSDGKENPDKQSSEDGG